MKIKKNVLNADMSLSSNVCLHADWIKRKDAFKANKLWHYSSRNPMGALICIGFWENKDFIGTIIFGNGSNCMAHRPFNLQKNEFCELVRIALKTNKQNPTSAIIMKAIKMIKENYPHLKIVVSYSDIEQDHHGGIYQATNWFYLGRSGVNAKLSFFYKGDIFHTRTHKPMGSPKNIIWIYSKGKHKYIFPLDKKRKKILEKLKFPPYPKRGDHVRPKAINIDLS